MNAVNPLDFVDKKEAKKSAATTIVEIAQREYDFGFSTSGIGFAVPKNGPPLVSMIRGNKSLRSLLAKIYFRENRRAASQLALTDALQIIDGLAEESCPQDLYLRVADHEGNLILDLGDQTGRAIVIDKGTWHVTKSPVLFRRTALTSALPEPEPNGDILDLFRFLNVTERDRPLLIAWLVSSLYPNIPHPVLAFLGEQGSGKSSASKLIVQTIDPSPVPVRKPPRDQDSWVTAANGSWVVAVDNLSSISVWFSDSICRAVTGDGDVRRQLYTDGDVVVFAFRRCVILNGIDLGAIRGDLGDRMIPIYLDPIPDERRLYEQEMWGEWEKAHPRILGGLLDVAARVASLFSRVSLSCKPRMADFARILAAVDQVLGTDGLAHYLEKQNSLAADSLTGDLFVSAIEKLGSFTGTSSELLERVSPDKPPRDWPRNARAVTQLLRRQAPEMRKAGWVANDDRGRNKSHATVWEIIPPTDEKRGNPTSPTSPDRQNCELGEVASQTSNGYDQSHYDTSINREYCPKCVGEGCGWCKPPSAN